VEILFQSPAIVADLVVLTIDALEVAMRKKNVADSLRSADDRFFTPVDANGTDVE
jgi:hypothetical protein